MLSACGCTLSWQGARRVSAAHARVPPSLPPSLPRIPFLPLRAQTTLILTGATWSSWSSRCRRLALLLATCPGVLPPCAAILPARLATAQRPPPDQAAPDSPLPTPPLPGQQTPKICTRVFCRKVDLALCLGWPGELVGVCVCVFAVRRLRVRWPSVKCCCAFDATARQSARHRDPKP